MATFLTCGRRGCKHEVFLLYVHRQINYFRELCAAAEGGAVENEEHYNCQSYIRERRSTFHIVCSSILLSEPVLLMDHPCSLQGKQRRGRQQLGQVGPDADYGYQTEARARYRNSYRLIALSKSLAAHMDRASESHIAAMVAFGSRDP